MSEPKLTVIMSPRHGTGTTTLGNYLALDIANDKSFGGLVLYIEFSKDTGKSLYMQKRLSERRRSLANVVYDVNTLEDNILKSMHSDRLFILALNIHDDFLKISPYSNEISSKLVSEAFKKFDHVIFDLPADFKENIVGSTIGRRFTHDINNLLIVLDEDALTFKDLSNLSSYLRLGNEIKPLYVTYVSNKVTKNYVDFIGQKLEMPLIKPLNLIKVPFMEEMTDCCNRGALRSLGTGKVRKEFDDSISKLKEIVLSQKRIVGIGVKPILPDDDVIYGEQNDNFEHNTKKKGFSLFGSNIKLNKNVETIQNDKNKRKMNLFNKKNKNNNIDESNDESQTLISEDYNESVINENDNGELDFDLDFDNSVDNNTKNNINDLDEEDFSQNYINDLSDDFSNTSINEQEDEEQVQEVNKGGRKSLFSNIKKLNTSSTLSNESNIFVEDSSYNEENSGYDNYDDDFDIDFDEDFSKESVKSKNGIFKKNKKIDKKSRSLFNFKNKSKTNIEEKDNNEVNKMFKFRKNK